MNPPPRRWLLSADLGQSSDPTAIGLAERLPARDVYRALERPDLGTPYPDIARRLGAIVRNPLVADGIDLVLDATGVGRPVVDLVREELAGGPLLEGAPKFQGMTPDDWSRYRPRPPCPHARLVSVIITGGTNARQDESTGYWSVPKSVLVSSLQVELQNGRAQFARALPLAETLLAEMRNFKEKTKSKTGASYYEAWRSGDHDDLVLMAAMGAWWSRRLARPVPADPASAEARAAAEIKAAHFRRLEQERKRLDEAARVAPWRRR